MNLKWLNIFSGKTKIFPKMERPQEILREKITWLVII